MWRIQVTGHFEVWWNSLSDKDQDRLRGALGVLSQRGPGMGRPLVETLSASRYPNMKELRVGTMRVLFAFNPLRHAVLLLGGNKRGRWNLWYRQAIPRADDLYNEHLNELRNQGLIP
ncbi:type II toxin-antitoxin system RelE/ParE family toxin [Candidatus Poriferisocius sp.]|uniref:type II toxin-antitoxin system RelE/ParE family toxin n=1 Tax=Candidatus Poriferisocius sp. TaxID=3101276 RepID=UPI003B01C559